MSSEPSTPAETKGTRGSLAALRLGADAWFRQQEVACTYIQSRTSAPAPRRQWRRHRRNFRRRRLASSRTCSPVPCFLTHAVVILFKQTGDAPILKQNKVKVCRRCRAPCHAPCVSAARAAALALHALLHASGPAALAASAADQRAGALLQARRLPAQEAGPRPSGAPGSGQLLTGAVGCGDGLEPPPHLPPVPAPRAGSSTRLPTRPYRPPRSLCTCGRRSAPPSTSASRRGRGRRLSLAWGCAPLLRAVVECGTGVWDVHAVIPPPHLVPPARPPAAGPVRRIQRGRPPGAQLRTHPRLGLSLARRRSSSRVARLASSPALHSGPSGPTAGPAQAPHP